MPMPNDTRRYQTTGLPGSTAVRQPAWAAEAPDEAFSILEHAEAIAMVDDLRPYCTRWSVELLRPDIANEIGLIIGGPDAAAIWAIYRDADRILHFEDLTAGSSYTFGTMSAGLRFVRAVIEAQASTEAEVPVPGHWWNGLPAWLLVNSPVQPGM